MTSIAEGSVKIQATSESNLSTPSWFGEVVLLSRHLHRHGVLSKISEQVRFARKRFGHYEVIDFLPASGYAPPATATSWKAGRFTGSDFPLQPDGTLRCPAGSALIAHEQRREVDGSLRVVYGASIRNCRPCPLRDQCQWNGSQTSKPRQVSILLHPLVVGEAQLLRRDWSRRLHRRACMDLLHSQRVDVHVQQSASLNPALAPPVLSRAQRAHMRLSWQARLTRNPRAPDACQVNIKLYGLPQTFAKWLGLTA